MRAGVCWGLPTTHRGVGAKEGHCARKGERERRAVRQPGSGVHATRAGRGPQVGVVQTGLAGQQMVWVGIQCGGRANQLTEARVQVTVVAVSDGGWWGGVGWGEGSEVGGGGRQVRPGKRTGWWVRVGEGWGWAQVKESVDQAGGLGAGGAGGGRGAGQGGGRGIAAGRHSSKRLVPPAMAHSVAPARVPACMEEIGQNACHGKQGSEKQVETRKGGMRAAAGGGLRR